MKKHDVDDHLVVHDVVTLGLATALGVVATAVTGEPAVGVATTGILAAAGISGMRVGPVRRTVNRTALVLSEAMPSKPEAKE